MSIGSTTELFEHMLRDMLYAEHKNLKCITDYIDKADDAELRDSFRAHFMETERQIERLELVFDLCDFDLRTEKCEALNGIIDEGKHMCMSSLPGPVRDAAMIVAAQKILHYEICSYGTLCEFANTLGLSEVARILGDSLAEEKSFDAMLTRIAESGINVRATLAAA